LSTLPWYADTSSAAAAVTFHSGVTQSDLGSGVKAASFDGTSGYLELLHTPAYGAGTGDFTFEFFVKATSEGTGRCWSAYEPSVGYWAVNTMGIAPLAGGISYYSERAGGDRFSNSAAAGGNLINNTWHHVAIVRSNGNVLKEYVNGQLVATHTDASDMYTDGTSEMYFGHHVRQTERYSADGYWGGLLAGIRVSHSARYTGSSFTVPTTAFTSDSNTKLLLNFGATSYPSV
jgi:hypothetical protein